MTIEQISPSSVIANPANVNLQVKADQAIAITLVNQDAKKAVQASKTDSATFSQQAVKKVVNDVHTAVQQLKDGAEKRVDAKR